MQIWLNDEEIKFLLVSLSPGVVVLLFLLLVTIDAQRLAKLQADRFATTLTVLIRAAGDMYQSQA